ncbi:hypothetical protein [Parendozoicomonas haliclonae]|uniref:Uncharacterized protein n=1 Tax=Parendozoicomonas haliclonae TaxID=1960125 RepID=A0A1X7AKR9_9GAMM|nr:hypothetical protein [Parendozoicomonas haliclonae]SMA48022.1 hypothetical protein EHSB41UT_02637 [Parendozoicomonas haliclonae]
MTHYSTLQNLQKDDSSYSSSDRYGSALNPLLAILLVSVFTWTLM